MAHPRRPLVLAALVFGLALSAFFGVEAVRSVRRIAAAGIAPGSLDADAIRGWMTVPYVARVFNIPRDELYRRIGVPSAGSDAKSLKMLSKEYYPGRRAYLLEKVREAVGAGPP